MPAQSTAKSQNHPFRYHPVSASPLSSASEVTQGFAKALLYQWGASHQKEWNQARLSFSRSSLADKAKAAALNGCLWEEGLYC